MKLSLLSVAATIACLAFRVNVVDCNDLYKQVYPPEGEDANGTRPLYIAFLISFGGDYTTSGAIPGVQVAIDQINSDPSILPGYTLHYTLEDSNCTRSTALDSFHGEILQEPTKIAMIGAGCSVATEPTAEISQYYNITQISCVSTSDALSNRNRFRSYFQLQATENTLAGGFYGVIRQYEWKQIGIITQNENLFTQTMDLLKHLLDESGVNSTERLFSSDNGLDLGDDPFMQEQGIRIFVLAMYSQRASDILCQAYNRGIRYPQYLFLTYGWYESNWWIATDLDNFNCTDENRESVLNNSLAVVTAEFIEDPSIVADTGINGTQYQDAYDVHLDNSEFDLDPFIYGQNCYDATWALVYALNNTITEISSNETLNAILAETAGYPNSSEMFQLDNFTYHNRALRDVIFRHFEETDFVGITGRIEFGEDGIRPVTDRRILRYTFKKGGDVGQPVTMGRVEENGTDFFLVLHNELQPSIWEDGPIPYDGVPLPVDVHASVALAVIIYILAAAGVVFAIVCLVFNFVFRQRKLIRLSSPNLNYLIGAGAIILYIDICFFPVLSTDPTVVSVACNLTPWLTALGYSLCYGTIVVKMWRVYYLFHDPLTKKKNITDWMLALAVLLLCVVDLIILVLYTAIEGTGGNLEAVRVRNRELPTQIRGELNIIDNFYFYTCDSQARDIFLGILYGYKAALQILALVLSFGIRKVKVKGLDDSKYIAAAVYVTSIVLAVIIVVTYTLDEFINGYAAVFCTGFFIGTTVILCIVFIPKMVGLYKDPEGNNVFAKSTTQQQLPSSGNGGPIIGSGLKTAVPTRGSVGIEGGLSFSSIDNTNRERELSMLRMKVKELQGKLSEQDSKKGNTLTLEETICNGVTLDDCTSD